jgi:hypothetical protein
MKSRRAVNPVILALCLFALFFSLSACGGAGPSPTANGTGPLTLLSVTGGKVMVMRPGETEWINAEEGMTLGEDYKVKTPSGGHATITFFDGSTIELEGGTEITLSELGLDGTASHISIGQSVGKTVSRVKKLLDPASSYEIETPAAIAAVRGTEFYVSVTKNGVTTIGSIEGPVGVTAQGVEIELAAGERTTVQPGKPPGEPEPDITPTSERK